MQFLKTLFWVVVAIALTLFAIYNWKPVTLTLWSGLQADVKLPFLIGSAVLLGFLPTYFVYRGRIWTLRRRYERPERVSVGNQPAPTVPAAPTSDDPGLAI